MLIFFQFLIGVKGDAGNNGVDGSTGAPGIAGTNGVDGSNGAPGIGKFIFACFF